MRGRRSLRQPGGAKLNGRRGSACFCGSKTLIVRNHANGGGRNAPRRFMVVGRFGTLTLDEARKHARQLLSRATVGEDPAADRTAKRKVMKVSALIDLYEEEGCYIQRGKRQGEPMKDLTKSYTIARLRHHVVPLLGSKRVTEIGAGEIERFVRDVAAGRTAKDEKVRSIIISAARRG